MMPDLLGALRSVLESSPQDNVNILMPFWRGGDLSTHTFSAAIEQPELLESISPHMVEAWLARLYELSLCGDLETVQTQIQNYRNHLFTKIDARSGDNNPEKVPEKVLPR
jgi:hypothetical protein